MLRLIQDDYASPSSISFIPSRGDRIELNKFSEEIKFASAIYPVGSETTSAHSSY
jgi:hypothetical protein